METADAVVIGGGVMGTSVAFHLVRRRFGRVVLLEQHTVCSGTSAKSSAIVRTHYTNPTTAAMALLARRVFERWGEEVGGECGFVQVGMLVAAPAASRPTVERTVAMNQGLGIETGLVSPDDVRALSPLLSLAEDAVVVWEPRSGYGSPHEVAGSFARRFGELGGDLRQSTPATGIEVRNGRVEAVRTPRGDIAAAHVVLAPGPWAARAGRLAGLDLPVTASRESIVTLRPAPGTGFHPRHPVVADLIHEIYLRPETGGLLLLGNTRDTLEPGDPDRYEDHPPADDVADLAARLSALMPVAADAAITGGWSGMYEVSPDWNPIMGTAGSVAGLHYAVGFSGHGFKLSPVVGLLMAEQVAEGRARTLDISPYRLERFAAGQTLRPAYTGAGVIG
jgi:glycine/D-amino acid oxidase-like deaminating enzyme